MRAMFLSLSRDTFDILEHSKSRKITVSDYAEPLYLSDRTDFPQIFPDTIKFPTFSGWWPPCTKRHLKPPTESVAKI